MQHTNTDNDKIINYSHTLIGNNQLYQNNKIKTETKITEAGAEVRCVSTQCKNVNYSRECPIIILSSAFH